MSTSAASPAAPLRPGLVGLSVIEVGAWTALFASAALSFQLAGAFGMSPSVSPSRLVEIRALTEAGGFDFRTAVLVYGLIFALSAAGAFANLTSLGARALNRVCAGLAGGTAVLALTQFLVNAAWLGVVIAVLIGATVSTVLGMADGSPRKPWRTAGIAAALALFAAYTAHLLQGPGYGPVGLRWLLLIAAVVLVAGAIIALISPPVGSAEIPATGAFPRSRASGVRSPEEVSSAWPCQMLFAVLGGVLVLAQPTVADLGFAQGGMALVIVAGLLGWAAGFEVGPTFAPGVSRPRLTALALVGAGALTILIGVLNELSGRAVLTGAVAFLVGLGVRAQEYRFSRRYGVIPGALGALLLAAFSITGSVPLTSAVTWELGPTDVPYLVLGTAALIGGLVALVVFVPHGLRGFSVDLLHAFRPPSEHRPDAGLADGAGAAAGADSAVGAGASGDAAGNPAASAAAGRLLAASPRAHHGLPGLFIAVEGGDGSGKSTQIAALASALRERGYEVVTTREPGGTDAGVKMRSVLLDGEGVSPRSEILLFAADRAHHAAQLIRPVLARGGIVITDRFIDSSRAYQAAGREFSDAQIAGLSYWAVDGLTPDLTLILDVDADTARRRTADRGDANHLDAESEDFRARVRSAFLGFAAADPDRYAVIDTTPERPVVSAAILDAVRPLLERVPQRSAAPTAGDASEAETTVLPSAAEPPASAASARPPEPQRSATPDVPPAAAAGAAPSGARAAGPTGRGPAADPGEAETTVLSRPTSAGAEQAPGPVRHSEAQRPAQAPSAPTSSDPSEAETTVLPAAEAHSAPAQPSPDDIRARARSRDRLRAQAEIERQARDRLRAQRQNPRSPLSGGAPHRWDGPGGGSSR